jgi:hypothetical protein
MNVIPQSPITATSPLDARWELAQRVADSRYFRKGTKLQAFLLYACENTLLGRPENVCEHLIGSKVFGRPSEYDLSTDNIVRVEARELRKRLEAYFAAEGRNESLVIEIPKGTYIPVFKPREQVTAVTVNIKDARQTETLPVLEQKRRKTRWWLPALSVGMLLFAAALLWLAGERAPVPGIAKGAAADISFYHELLGTLGAAPDREALLVLSNPRVAPHDGILPPKPTIEEFTGMGEAVAAFRLGRLFQLLQRPVRLTQSRFLNWDHIQKLDLIILGGPRANNWAYQDAAKSNFNFVIKGVQPPGIQNLEPRPGEQPMYPWPADPAAPGGIQVEYGVIKMLVSPYGFNVLLLAGMTSAGTWGTAEFFASPEKMRGVYERLRAAAPGQPFPSPWEAVIKVSIRECTPIETSVVALRPAPASKH